LHFHWDVSLEHVEKIEKKLHDLKAEEKAASLETKPKEDVDPNAVE